jgi:hypothetical protein
MSVSIPCYDPAFRVHVPLPEALDARVLVMMSDTAHLAATEPSCMATTCLPYVPLQTTSRTTAWCGRRTTAPPSASRTASSSARGRPPCGRPGQGSRQAKSVVRVLNSSCPGELFCTAVCCEAGALVSSGPSLSHAHPAACRYMTPAIRRQGSLMPTKRPEAHTATQAGSAGHCGGLHSENAGCLCEPGRSVHCLVSACQPAQQPCCLLLQTPSCGRCRPWVHTLRHLASRCESALARVMLPAGCS